MRRAPIIVLAVGAAALLLALLLGLLAGVAMIPSYLAAWLFWAAFPIGALPLLMALDLLGGAWSAPLLPALRRLALTVPVAGLLIVPVLVRLHALYPWARGVPPHGPLGAAWLGPAGFVIRAIVYFVIWTALAVIFARPAAAGRRRRRRLAAGFGLALHLAIATLAAVDWTLSLDPGWYSAEFGLLLIAAQCCIALAAAILIGASAADPEPGMPHPGALLLALAGVWLYFQFVQFLTVWSADKPGEIVWYLHRDGDGGRTIEWLVFVAGFLLPFCILIPRTLRRHLSVLALAAVLVLFAHGLEMLWFVTPAFRQHFSLRGSDILALIGVGGIAIGTLMLADPERPAMWRASHG